MARPKAFDQEQALAAAMDVFWRVGYERASLELLLEAMGISKQSLYDTYGDKRALYLKALAQYRKQTLTSMRTLFACQRTTQAVLAAAGVERGIQEQHARGCLLLRTAAQISSVKPMTRSLRRSLPRDQAAVEAIFADAMPAGNPGGKNCQSPRCPATGEILHGDD